MNIVVGKLAGFCGGVINSVSKTDKLLEDGIKTYCLGELVHNKQVVDKLKDKGLVFIDTLEEVEDGSRVIIRAHGVTKETYELAKKKNLDIIDLTCPNVLRIHEKAIKLVEDDFFIVLIAQKDHPEAIGTISFCGKDSVILEDKNGISEVVRLFKNSGKTKLAVISQTTYSMLKFDELVEELKNQLNDYEINIDNTICSATELRQKETSKLSEEVDAMIIIGGKNSSNTKKLYDIASSKCKNTYIVETIDDLKEDMSVFDIVGVMAGASTPKESIDEVVDYLKSVN
ncbi:MAG: 4-hydroxy-3-methylbut-2-enyl diphosphate reductase [Firmicutes bacterium]|nr:4-hydroxy-3-methylbut-2-enyl diphosphate reductase [Bacillota bacterium]